MGKKKSAKKRGATNKSQAIRDYVADNPQDGPKAVSAALSKNGVSVTPEFVSTVKSTDKRKAGGGKRRKGRKKGRSTAAGSSSLSDTVKALSSAKQLVEALGGAAAAKQAIDAYAKLVEQ